MSGKRLDIWGLPIDDDDADGDGAKDAAVQESAPLESAESDASTSEFATLEEESTPVATSVAGAIAQPVQDAWVEATIGIEPGAEETAPATDAAELTEEDVLAAAPARAPESETTSTAEAVADTPALAAAPAVGPKPEVVEAPEPVDAEVHAPDAVLVTEATTAVVEEIESPSTEEIATETAAQPEPAPQVDAQQSIVREESASRSDETQPATTAAPAAASAEEESQPKPARAWIPPGRRKKSDTSDLPQTGTGKSTAQTSAADQSTAAQAAMATSGYGQADFSPPENAGRPMAVGEPVTGSAAQVESAPEVAASTDVSLPVIPPASTASSSIIDAAAQGASTTTDKWSASYAPTAAKSSSTTSSTDDFWGVPPKPGSATPAPLPPAPRPAATSTTAAITNRSAPMSMPTAASTTSAAPSPAPVGGLVPQAYTPPETRTTSSTQARPVQRPKSEGRIEVINPEGWKREFPLRRSILYVGSAAGSDILLPVAEIAPRHLQFVPSTSNRMGYRMINLGGASVVVRGAGSSDPREVASRASTELNDGDRIEVGGYTIAFYSGDMSSQVIQLRLEAPIARVELDKPLEGALYIRNGGDRAGVQFLVEVQGIDNRFVQIESGPVLFPDGEKRVAFRISHPHASSPAAGDQPINFVVTAPEGYPGETAVASLVVSIAPYFAHKVRLIAIEPELSGYSLSSG